MSPTVLVVTDRPAFEESWYPVLARAGLETKTVDTETLSRMVGKNDPVLIDAGSEFFDEDELLTCIGLVRALDGITAVAISADNSMEEIMEILDDLCPGLVAHDSTENSRIANALVRRCDTDRYKRFEYVTVSPRPEELLILFGDGNATLLSRPINQEDDGSEIISITLSDDASVAVLALESGKQVSIEATSLTTSRRVTDESASGINTSLPIDGAQLGARLRKLRLEAGLTQAELARRTGIHRPNIARVEAGRHTPSLETLAKFSSAIGVPTSRILSD